MTMKMALIGLGGLVLAAASTFGFAAAKMERADCPGKIVCPLTGKLVCRNQCPVAAKATSVETAVPTCCQKK